MRHIHVLFLHFLLHLLLLHLQLWYRLSDDSIKYFFTSSSGLIQAHHFFIIIVVIFVRIHAYALILFQNYNIVIVILYTNRLIKVMRKRKEIKLSDFLHKNSVIKNKKFDASGKNIGEIGDIDAYICSEVETLNLSNNRLKSLKGISQLNFLQELDISQNRIESCKELQHLLSMYQLKKIYINNNPFLNEPIDEHIFEFIMTKETDIQILSYQVLNSIKELQEKQIKIIFLKNYLNKIDVHSQMKKRYNVQKADQHYLMEDLITKIVPQLYSTIEDPSLTNLLKKEAFFMKRQKNQSIQSTIQYTHKVKEELINELIKDIVQLLDSNEQFKQSETYLLQVNFKDNTINFSPDNRKKDVMLKNQSSIEFSPVRYMSVDKNQHSFEEITLMNIRNRQLMPKSTQYSENNHRVQKKQQTFPESIKKTLKKQPQISTISQKLKSYSNFKNNYQTQLKKMKQRSEHSNNKKQYRYQTPFNNKFVNQNKHLINLQKDQMYQKAEKTPHNDQFIRVEQDVQIKEENRKYINISPRNHQSSFVSARGSAIEPLTLENMETFYFRTLSKTNPMFNLLLSPSNTLNLHQKNQILQALKIDHKDKFFDYLRQKQKNEKILKELEEQKFKNARNIQEITQNNRNIYNQYLVYKQQFQWIQKRQNLSHIRYQELLQQFQSLENVHMMKEDRISILEANLKRLKQSYSHANAKIINYEQQEKNEEIIMQKHHGKIIKKYLSKLQLKAKILYIVNTKFKEKKKIQNLGLKKWGLTNLKSNMIAERIIKWKIFQKNNQCKKQHFDLWKSQCQLDKKQKRLSKKIVTKRFLELTSHLKRNQAYSKMSRLKNIWALRFLNKKTFEKTFAKIKNISKDLKNKEKLALNHSSRKILMTYFFSFLGLLQSNKNKSSQVNNNHINTIKKSSLNKLMFLAQKQKMEFQLKENQVNKAFQNNRQRIYIKKFIQRSKVLNNNKNKIKLCTTFLKQKIFRLFAKQIKNNSKIFTRMRQNCFRLQQLVRFKMIARQKKSHDLQYKINYIKKESFLFKFKEFHKKKQLFQHKKQKISTLKDHQKAISKLYFIKTLQLSTLLGKNYVKYRTIQQMNYQMNLHQQKTIELVIAQKQQQARYSKEILHLRNQINHQSLRQILLLKEKDDLLLSINEHYEIMMQLRKQVDLFRLESMEQEDKYNKLIELYNEAKKKLQKKEQEYNALSQKLKIAKK